MEPIHARTFWTPNRRYFCSARYENSRAVRKMSRLDKLRNFIINRRLACRDRNGFMEHVGALENWSDPVRQSRRWTQRLPCDDDQESPGRWVGFVVSSAWLLLKSTTKELLLLVTCSTPTTTTTIGHLGLRLALDKRFNISHTLGAVGPRSPRVFIGDISRLRCGIHTGSRSTAIVCDSQDYSCYHNHWNHHPRSTWTRPRIRPVRRNLTVRLRPMRVL